MKGNIKLENALEKAGYKFLGSQHKYNKQDKLKIEQEMQLQFNISQIFTKKEKQIMRNILDADEDKLYKKLYNIKPLTKTDREIWSRMKKKFEAIFYLKDFAMVMHSINLKEEK